MKNNINTMFWNTSFWEYLQTRRREGECHSPSLLFTLHGYNALLLQILCLLILKSDLVIFNLKKLYRVNIFPFYQGRNWDSQEIYFLFKVNSYSVSRARISSVPAGKEETFRADYSSAALWPHSIGLSLDGEDSAYFFSGLLTEIRV